MTDEKPLGFENDPFNPEETLILQECARYALANHFLDLSGYLDLDYETLQNLRSKLEDHLAE
jgi:hypothetical protein